MNNGSLIIWNDDTSPLPSENDTQTLPLLCHGIVSVRYVKGYSYNTIRKTKNRRKVHQSRTNLCGVPDFVELIRRLVEIGILRRAWERFEGLQRSGASRRMSSIRMTCGATQSSRIRQWDSTFDWIFGLAEIASLLTSPALRARSATHPQTTYFRAIRQNPWEIALPPNHHQFFFCVGRVECRKYGEISCNKNGGTFWVLLPGPGHWCQTNERTYSNDLRYKLKFI